MVKIVDEDRVKIICAKIIDEKLVGVQYVGNCNERHSDLNDLRGIADCKAIRVDAEKLCIEKHKEVEKMAKTLKWIIGLQITGLAALVAAVIGLAAVLMAKPAGF